MRHPDPVEVEQRYFDDVTVGTKIPEREYGPHTLTSAVFWAAVQENVGLLHFDRDYVREHRGAKSIVVSGQQRQSYVVRTLLDWHRAGSDVQRELPRLATFLGHAHTQHTYWYLEAVPELLELIGRRLDGAFEEAR